MRKTTVTRFMPSARILITLISCLIPLTHRLPAHALGRPVGVIKSQENTPQWRSITNRLQLSGVDYCIIDSKNWEEIDDIGQVQVLILPNVASITGAQAIALEQWMQRGGKVIVTGPTGSLAQPDVKRQLKSLFGAYWAFPNSTPSTLKLMASPAIATRTNLSSTLVGGVLIPTGLNSRTAAVWVTDGTPPAVVMNDQATFFGWRWGLDEVTSASLDIAWLQTALSRFGVRATQSVFTGQAPACPSGFQAPTAPIPLVPSFATPIESPVVPQPQNLPPSLPPTPPLPLNYQSPPPAPPATDPRSQYNTEVLLTNRPEPGLELGITSPAAIAPQQVTAMRDELASLIARFESTLISAEATQNTENGPIPETLNQSLVSSSGKSTTTLALSPHARRAYETLQNARESLAQFQELVEQRNYTQAREKWLKARRLLWDHYPTDQTFAQPEVRAMWLDRGTIVKTKSETELAVIFDRMAEAGINTVFFETLNASYPIYPSKIAPEQNPLTQGWDPLKAAVKLAHERGMEIHAWVWTFAAANQGHNKVLDQSKDYLGPVLSRYPDWGITDRAGNAFDQGAQFKKAFYDPANAQVRQYLLALFEEIVTNYDVDGLQLDYIRYPFQDAKHDQTYGFSAVSRKLFEDIYGVDPIEITPVHPLWSSWVGFRVRQVDSFVATVSAQLKQKRPDLMISTAVFPMERQDRLFRLQQNWEEWMSQEWIDMVVLMTYALDTGSLEERTAPLFDPSVLKSTLVIPGLRLLKVPDSVTVDQLQLLRNMPTGGYALFAAENLTPTLQTILGRMQGTQKTTQQLPLPYRQPFKASNERYKALQGEWRFLLSQNQLKMNPTALQTWAKQSDQLGEVLAQLVENPSQQNLTKARGTLNQFRGQFGTWMTQQQENHPYQVQVWENRLATLEKLLVYGERKILRERQPATAAR